MNVSYRQATADDAVECLELRGRTRENALSEQHLAAIGITAASFSSDISNGSVHGYICVEADEIVGYCFGDRSTGEILVLALLPAFENRGFGKALLTRAVEYLGDLGHTRLFLGCSPNSEHRSYGFYRHMGWKSTGEFDANQDEVLEYNCVQHATNNAA